MHCAVCNVHVVSSHWIQRPCHIVRYCSVNVHFERRAEEEEHSGKIDEHTHTQTNVCTVASTENSLGMCRIYSKQQNCNLWKMHLHHFWVCVCWVWNAEVCGGGRCGVQCALCIFYLGTFTKMILDKYLVLETRRYSRDIKTDLPSPVCVCGMWAVADLCTHTVHYTRCRMFPSPDIRWRVSIYTGICRYTDKITVSHLFLSVCLLIVSSSIFSMFVFLYISFCFFFHFLATQYFILRCSSLFAMVRFVSSQHTVYTSTQFTYPLYLYIKYEEIPF